MCSMSHQMFEITNIAISILLGFWHHSRVEQTLTRVRMNLQEQSTSEIELETDLTREQRRSRRKRSVRARTICVKRLSRRELELGRYNFNELDVERPKTRAECIEGPRPCPFVSCKHHLYLDVSPRTGSIKLNFPDLEVWEMASTCALDVADGGGATLEDVGAILNVTRERVRQLEVKALTRLTSLRDMHELREYVSAAPVPPPRALRVRR